MRELEGIKAMDKGINSFVSAYQEQIRKGDIQKTYAFLRNKNDKFQFV